MVQPLWVVYHQNSMSNTPFVNFIMHHHLSEQQLREILETQYELRSPMQQQTVISIVQQALSYQCSNEKAKLISFFLSANIKQQHPLLPPSIVVRKDQISRTFKAEQLTKSAMIKAQHSGGVMFVEKGNILKCQILDWRSPEEEVKFLQSLPIFSDIPKKRLYPVLRHSNILQFHFGETFFKEGDPMSNCFYLVRKGQFCFSKYNHAILKNSELLTVKAGYIFQHQASVQNDWEDNEFFYPQSTQLDSKFNYTIKCKSGTDTQFFLSYLIKFCQDRLVGHLESQIEYLKRRAEYIQSRRSHSQLAMPITKSQQQQLFRLTASTVSSARHNPKLKEQKRIFDLFEKDSNYCTIKESMPRRDKLFSKQQLKKLCPNPELDESQALIWKKAKCSKLKQLTRSPSKVQARGEILLSFTTSAILLEKIRKKIFFP